MYGKQSIRINSTLQISRIVNILPNIKMYCEVIEINLGGKCKWDKRKNPSKLDEQHLLVSWLIPGIRLRL